MSHWASVEKISDLGNRAFAGLALVPASGYRFAAYLFIVIWFLVMLSELFWSFIPVPEVKNSDQALAIMAKPQQKQSQADEVNVETMRQWHLFGQAEQLAVNESIDNVAVADDVNEDARETRLNLTLMGLFEAEDDPADGFASIEHQGKSELYKVGDKVPGGRDVQLAKVLTDRVILDNRGSYEALLLWDENQRVKPTATPEQRDKGGRKQVLDQRSNSEISAMASKYRKQLLSNPMSLADVIKVSVAKDGEGNIIGYRIRPGRHRKQFSQFGLKSGDIVTAVNGTALDDPAQAMQLYGQLKTATEASFDVKRGNEDLTLIINLSDGE